MRSTTLFSPRCSKSHPWTLKRRAAAIVQCIYQPAFHRECAISFVAGDEKSHLRIRTARRSIWAHLNAQAGSSAADPVFDWVDPPVSSEKHDLDSATSQSLRDLADRCSEAALSTEADAFGLDGMVVKVSLGGDSLRRADYRAWFGGFDSSNPAGEVAWLSCRCTETRC